MRCGVKINSDDTIVAISTLAGFAGIGIVRLSGPAALYIASKIFHPKSKKKIKELSANTVHLGKITDGKKFVDEVLLTVMKAPKSYTREDIVEISCHGGTVPLKKTLELCVKYGARLADPGEFTKRAYLNGRIDLSQAEAVCDIIKAKTEAALSCAVSQLSGVLSEEINSQKSELVDILATMEAAIDYSEDEVPVIDGEEIISKVEKIGTALEKILLTFQTGKIFRDGVRTAIIGKPNVGKSSLLNVLVGQNRAIVTEIPGTTRDIIEETIDISGIPLILTDTAGIRKHSTDVVEKIGIERAQETLKTADLVLFVLDSSSELSHEDFHIAELLVSKKVILVLNKSDKSSKIGNVSELEISAPVVTISASKNEGLEELKKIIYNLFITSDINTSDFMLTNTRHKILVENALGSLEKAIVSVKDGLSEEFTATDLRSALNYLGEITGEVPTEEILDRIFSNFCVGK
ncbi:MAG: tRNA uridine-5-carboxymethylaminomethyl(34) synthesis GTPase MnmE [Elusimicrobia bacterium]|nr:tRNA uridine-5-carboxymethylaminomethyl(34) synthesis GTPase MnmE [Elusimicrobiota bacterium]